MAIALVLVVLVMALFLRRFWATIIPVVTIPIAIAATLVVMYFLDFSLDNISLMALTIAIGFASKDGRRHHHREHRATDPGRRAADRCCAQGYAANGLHRRLDDARL